ncbi:MAG: rhodanese-like protein [Rickettsiaceae bacterium]|jgi:rhodanese-related sulfurtransferase|nr:rhodanese-like protein [Rickettsiaceae bacterium]
MVSQISALEAWKILEENPNSILVDVRTKEEVNFVGFADLSKINSKAIFLPWKIYPKMSVDEAFTDKLSALIADHLSSSPEQINLLFLCAGGSRSVEAALFMSDLGYNCYSINNGFEGSLDEFGHRGTINGWKASNLPWKQN